MKSGSAALDKITDTVLAYRPGQKIKVTGSRKPNKKIRIASDKSIRRGISK